MAEYEVILELSYERSGSRLILLQGCYVFSPEDSNGASQRPMKRKKVEKGAQVTPDQDENIRFVPLLRGSERAETVKYRSDVFKSIWDPQERLINVHYCQRPDF